MSPSLILACAIGVGCRLGGIPSPALPALVGALLALAMTAGYLVVDRAAAHRQARHRHLCGGPTGGHRGAGAPGRREGAMTAALIGVALGLVIGAGCRWFDLPPPVPPKLVGTLLVVAMSLGFLATDLLLSRVAGEQRGASTVSG